MLPIKKRCPRIHDCGIKTNKDTEVICNPNMNIDVRILWEHRESPEEMIE